MYSEGENKSSHTGNQNSEPLLHHITPLHCLFTVVVRSLHKLNKFCQEGWSAIQPELCQKRVDGWCLVEVQLKKGHLAKY